MWLGIGVNFVSPEPDGGTCISTSDCFTHNTLMQVRDLMVYLEAQQHMQGSEMSQGTILPVPEAAAAPKRRGNRSRK